MDIFLCALLSYLYGSIPFGYIATYIIKGKHIFRYGSEDYELGGGDLIYFDGRTPHSVTALEPIQFISVYFRDKA